MPCPCTNRAKTRTVIESLSCSPCAAGLITQDSSLFTSPIPHAHTHAHTHTHQHTHSVYFKLMVIITPQMSYYQMTLPGSGHSQSSQVTCWNTSSLSHFSPVCLSENTPKLLFCGYICPATLLSSCPHLPPLPNSMSISQKRASNKMCKLVQFIFELSGQSHPLPILGVPLSHSAASRFRLQTPIKTYF